MLSSRLETSLLLLWLGHHHDRIIEHRAGPGGVFARNVVFSGDVRRREGLVDRLPCRTRGDRRGRVSRGLSGGARARRGSAIVNR